MKTALTLGSARFLMSALMALSISACTIEATDPDPSNDDEIAPAKAAASVNGTPLNVTSMKLQRGMWIPSSGGDSYTSNTVKLTASDGSSIDIRWDHEALGTFTTLESGYADSPGGTYTSPGGKKYHSISRRIASRTGR